MADPRAAIGGPTASISPDRRRAQQLLIGGAIGGHVGAAVATVAFFLVRGPDAGFSCLIAAVVALAFYVVGQAVQVQVADAPPARVLTAALVSYGVRVSALGGLLALALTQGDRLSRMDSTAVVVGALAVVVCWLAAEIVTFSRLRFPVFEGGTPNGETSLRSDDSSC